MKYIENSNFPHIILSVKDVDLRKDNRMILDSISFDIEAKGRWTIVGKNGCGKTMLLKMILGIESLTSGSIEKMPKLKISYIPQHVDWNRLIPITLKEFLLLNAGKTHSSLQDILEQTDMEHLQNTQITHLSGGELQRALLARALFRNIDMLILDEPEQRLDSQNLFLFAELLEKTYQKFQFSILMVSHQPNFFLPLSDFILLIQQDSPALVASVEDIVQYKEFQYLFPHTLYSGNLFENNKSEQT